MEVDERGELKRWLRGLREERGYSQQDVADLLGVEVKTIKNLESPRQGFANGLTMLRYLRLLGVVQDAPPEPAATDRLGSLERLVAEQLATIAEILKLNQDAFDELLPLVRALGEEAPPTGRRRRPA